MQSKVDSANTNSMFGKPALSFVSLQVYYDCYKHQNDPIFRKDRKWFYSHPHQRFIRAAMGEEFNHTEAGLDYFGKRVVPAKLWVSVDRRLGGQQHVVQPVYRGESFWAVDKHDYLVPDDGHNDVDKLLYQMHLSDGMNFTEMWAFAEKVAEVSLASAKQIGPVI